MIAFWIFSDDSARELSVRRILCDTYIYIYILVYNKRICLGARRRVMMSSGSSAGDGHRLEPVHPDGDDPRSLACVRRELRRYRHGLVCRALPRSWAFAVRWLKVSVVFVPRTGVEPLPRGQRQEEPLKYKKKRATNIKTGVYFLLIIWTRILRI